MIAKENPDTPHDKAAAAPPATERAGENVQAGPATAAAGVAQGARAAAANGAPRAYVPARRRSRRNLLL